MSYIGQGKGIDHLLEMVILTAEMQAQANPNRLARGTVIEARLDKGRALLPLCLFRTEPQTGRYNDSRNRLRQVRTMINDRGERLRQAPLFRLKLRVFRRLPEPAIPST